MHLPVLVIPLAISLLGCATPERQMGQPFNAPAVSQIRPGVTTKQTVESSVGAPSSRSVAATGEEMWLYQYSRIGGSTGGTQTQGAQVYFKGNVVSRCWISTNSATVSGSGFGVAPTVTTGPNNQVDCNDPRAAAILASQ